MMPEPKVELRGRRFRDAWNELVEVTAALRLSKVCESCPNQSICHSCAALAYAETGSFSGIPAYMCRAAQQMRLIALADEASSEAHP
jgi:MoaA/NifB/PqqE/SkfB family radical SAM enzyme